MMCHVMEWFYSSLAGISSEDGYHNIIISPQLPADMEWINCEYMAITGRITVQNRLFPDMLSIYVQIPPNTKAKIYFPDTFTKRKIYFGNEEIQDAVYEINGGVYTFTILKL